MKKIFLFISVFLCFSVFSISSSVAEGAPVLEKTERDPRTFCPYDKDISSEHLLLFIDVTDGISEQQINLIKNDIITDDLLGGVNLYGKVSLVVMDGNKPVTSLKPQLSICRPKSGNLKSPDKRDHIDFLTENRQKIELEYQLGYLRRFKDRSIEIVKEKAEGHNTEENTPIMEAIHEISRSSAVDFGKEYGEKRLIVVSNMYHHSKNLPLNKLCLKKIYRTNFSLLNYFTIWKCPSFKDVKNKRVNKFYLERKIKPQFKGNVDVKLWMLYKQESSSSIRDDSLLTFWEDYFDYVGDSVNFLDPEFESDPSS